MLTELWTSFIFLLLLISHPGDVLAQAGNQVPDNVMKGIYEEVKTPYKYGLVVVPPDDSKTADCPSVFRKNGKWYMAYIVFDGRGYETYLASSKDLINWKTLGRIMSFSKDSTDWDANQKAGYISLHDYKWGGKNKMRKFKKRYWMSYLGGNLKGFETLPLSIGMAFTQGKNTTGHEWDRLENPVLSSKDSDVRWWEKITLYKSDVIWDKKKRLGTPFVMFYNANGEKDNINRGTERIGMALSDDMVNWKRFGSEPILDHHKGITGDPQIQKIGNVWVMFYFGAFWPVGKPDGAFDNFACSYDLKNWTDWTGHRLIVPSEPFDDQYAHKPYVIKHKGIVYHFYVAVNKKDQRGIAVATSKNIGKSEKSFNNSTGSDNSK